MPSIAELEAQLAAAKAQAEPAEVVGWDANGQELHVGDTVTLTYQVIGVHDNVFIEDGGDRAGHVVNLAREGRHQFTVDALHVTKV